jgi:phage gpG-like protein
MQVNHDEWTPFLQSLKLKVNRQGRKQLLFQLIGEIYDITVLNFGEYGKNRPIDWKELTEKYAKEYHGGNTIPTLILDPQEHFNRNGTSKRMIDSFKTYVSSNKASITNTAAYADQHQLGAKYKGLPARPYYPINSNGTLTPFAEERLREIVDSHFGV